MTHRIAQNGYSALILMVEQIDFEISRATVTSKLFATFKIGRASFTIKKTFARLDKFRETVIKNRKAFSDIALQPVNNPLQKGVEAMTVQPQTPAIDRALAVLRASMNKLQPAAPQVAALPVTPSQPPTQPKPPRKARPVKAPQPSRDIWFYLTKKSPRASATA